MCGGQLGGLDVVLREDKEGATAPRGALCAFLRAPRGRSRINKSRADVSEIFSKPPLWLRETWLRGGSNASKGAAARSSARRPPAVSAPMVPETGAPGTHGGKALFHSSTILINALWLAQRGSRTAKSDKLEHDATLAATWGFVLRARLQGGIS